MSLFKATTLSCPSCAASVDFDVVHSINADRRPDLREAILDGSFQRKTCAACETSFRLDPKFTYMNLARNEWIAAYPLSELEHWPELEAHVTAMFAKSFGSEAPEAARALAENVKPRLVFGWSALREKLTADEAGYDDVELELLKVGLIRNLAENAFSLETELRFLNERPSKEPGGTKELYLAWLRGTTAEFLRGMLVPREVYDDIAKDQDGWKDLRTQLKGGMFVDMQRMIAVTTS